MTDIEQKALALVNEVATSKVKNLQWCSPLAYKALRLAFKAALRAAGLDTGLRLHDLRHAHGQWAVEAGVPEALVQVSLRHTQASTTRRYTKQLGRATVAAGLARHLTASPTDQTTEDA